MVTNNPRRLYWTQTLFIGFAAIVISMIRRPNQINYPEVWVEEGTQFIHQYLERGWLFLFEPVNGYLILPSKLNAWIAYHISFVHYPEISYILTLLTSAVVAMVIYRAPTLLPYKPIAALTPFLLPFDPEPIGIGEYAFWFVGLFSVLALIWAQEKHLKSRLALTLLGGLSAPLGVSILPLFIVRAAWTRGRSDVLVALAAALTTAIQLGFVFSSGASNVNYLTSLLSSPYNNLLIFITKFVSEFFWAREPSTLFGIGITMLMLVYLWRDVREGRFLAPALIVCAGISAVLSIIRVPLADIHAMGAGPRYFFYPYIFLAWSMLAFAAEASRRRVLAVGGILVLLNAATFILRPHDDLDWKGAVEACLASPEGGDLPVHFTGDKNIAWKVTLTQAECKKMERISIF